jgi:site-specific DNA-methyltransferase (adenine-specific)
MLEIRGLPRALFTSARGDWKTPAALYRVLDAEFAFDFDPCPSEPAFDGLAVPWGNRNYVNPPYGRKIGGWIDKAISEAALGKTVVLLVPSRTDTQWWHKLMRAAKEIRYIVGRLHFDDSNKKAPFPSAIIVLAGHPRGES